MIFVGNIKSWIVLLIAFGYVTNGAIVPISDKATVNGSDVVIQCEVVTAVSNDEELRLIKYNEGVAQLLADNINGLASGLEGQYEFRELTPEKRLQLTVLRVDQADQAEYACIEDLNTASDIEEAFYLNVSYVAVTDIYWTGRVSGVRVGQNYNLTCESLRSRPVSTFTWWRNGFNVTDQAEEWQGTPDVNGFGNAWSKIDMTIVEEDIGATYRCDVDVGLVHAAATETMVVKLAASSLSYNIIILAVLQLGIFCTTIRSTYS